MRFHVKGHLLALGNSIKRELTELELQIQPAASIRFYFLREDFASARLFEESQTIGSFCADIMQLVPPNSLIADADDMVTKWIRSFGHGPVLGGRLESK